MATRQGNTTSNSSLPYRTGPAPPLAGPIVNGTALNHTTVLITWYPPEIKKLRGSVVTYVVEMEETSLPGAPVSRVGQFPGNQNRVAVRNLKANTYYTFYVRLFHCYVVWLVVLNVLLFCEYPYNLRIINIPFRSIFRTKSKSPLKITKGI